MCASRGAQPGVAEGSRQALPGLSLLGIPLADAGTVPVLFASHLRARCSLATILWLVHAHTWIDVRCVQFYARRGRGGEPERRERAILITLSRLCCAESRSLRVQNSGWFWTQIMILGVLDMPDHISFT